MIRIKNGELNGALEALQGLAKVRLPATLALKVRRSFRQLAQLQDDMIETRQSLLRSHGKAGPDGKLLVDEQGVVQFDSPQHIQDYIAAYNELLECLVEADPLCSVAELQQLADSGKLDALEPSLLIGLGELISETE